MNRKFIAISQALATAALLAACGGSPDYTPGPSPAPVSVDVVPPTASTSVSGMVSYLATLSTLTPEDKEPADVSSFMPPVSDDTEPAAV